MDTAKEVATEAQLEWTKFVKVLFLVGVPNMVVERSTLCRDQAAALAVTSRLAGASAVGTSVYTHIFFFEVYVLTPQLLLSPSYSLANTWLLLCIHNNTFYSFGCFLLSVFSFSHVCARQKKKSVREPFLFTSGSGGRYSGLCQLQRLEPGFSDGEFGPSAQQRQGRGVYRKDL